MKQRYLKKPYSFLLVSAMVLTMFPTFSTRIRMEMERLHYAMTPVSIVRT